MGSIGPCRQILGNIKGDNVMGFKETFVKKPVAFFICLGAALAFVWVAAYAMAEETSSEWQVPAKSAKVKNPIASDAKSTDLGKKVYTAKCLSCHGTQGKGDGPMFKVLKKKPGDLSAAEVKAESDGALFWKITKGKTPMPSFAKNLTDKERWNAVNYVRTLNTSDADKK